MTKIIQRHDTAANWTSVNPVLAAGEMGVEYKEGTLTFTLSDAVTTNGIPTFNNGLVSNFSTSNYYSMNTMLVEEMVIQFTTGSEITQGQYISTYPSLNIENGKLRLGLPSGFQQLMAVSVSTQYTIKVINYSSKIEVYSSSTLIATFDTSLSSGGPRFGSNIDGYPFLGTIDFRNTSINGTSLTNKTEVFSGTSRFKFGDGSSVWSELAYAAGEGGGGGSGTQLTSADGETSYTTLALGDNLIVDTGDTPWTNPAMSSNSMDGYVLTASISSSSTGSAIYKAFDKDTSTSENCWYTGSASMPQWIMMECPEPVRLTSCMINNEVSTPVNFKSGYIQGSNDGSTFDTLYTIIDRPNTTGYSETYTFKNTTYYKYLRVYCTASYGSGLSIQEIEFKGFVKDASAIPSLNVNLDELGNEVNTLASAVSTLETSVTSKQDKLTAVSPIKIYADDIKNINVTPVSGAVINEDNTFTGGTGYLTYNHQWNLNAANSWEYKIKLKFGGWSTQTQAIFASIGADYQHPAQNFLSDGRIILYVSTNGTSWTTVVASSIVKSTFVAGNIYYFKFGFTGSKYYISYNTTGWENSFTSLASVNESRKVPSWTGTMGLCGPIQPCTSTLYLEEYSLTVDGENVFTALTVEPGALAVGANTATTTSLGVVKPDGTSITVSETGVISGQDVKTFSGYSDTGTLVLKSINGVLQWVAEG